MKTTIEVNGKGHFEVEFTDGLAGVKFYDNTLDAVIRMIANMTPARTVKSITWVED